MLLPVILLVGTFIYIVALLSKLELPLVAFLSVVTKVPDAPLTVTLTLLFKYFPVIFIGSDI